MIIVRYADDYIVGFQHQRDAQRFLADLRDRLARFGLELAAEKTRLIEFGRFAAHNRRSRGQAKPETFDFLGFKHICSKTRNGRFMLKRITSVPGCRPSCARSRIELRRRRHHPIPDQGRWLGSVVRGHMAYYAVPGNADAMIAFHDQVTRHWHKSLKRRSQRHNLPWTRMRSHRRALAAPGPTHAPLPQRPLPRQHPRQEPGALTRTPGSARGAAGNGGPYRHRWESQSVEAAHEPRLPGFAEDVVVRRFDAPEALDTRFHEVRTKSAINRVPPIRGCRSSGRSTRIAAAPMPALTAARATRRC